MSPPKVFVIGAGIAGPVLAILLKFKGYDPVLFERLDEVVEAGISLMLQPNGFKVLALIPDLIPHIPGRQVEKIAFYSQTSNEVLGETAVPTKLVERHGYGMMGVQRTAFHRLLVETAEKHGIKVFWGHQAISLEQAEHDVTVTFKNGVTDKASFVVGCDGLHSNIRIALFGQERPDFTGLVQTGGVSRTPLASAIGAKPTMANIFHIQSHMICYPISQTHSSWAVTSSESEAKETWRHMDEHQKEEFKKGPLSEWAFGGGELVAHAEKVIKYGLYDRPELKTWYKGRVVLLGDAAHPTTPHLGQGANQAFEDVYHFIRALVTHNPDTSAPSTAVLENVFADYESVRLERSSALVREAKIRGSQRVVSDAAGAKVRDEAIKHKLQDQEGMLHEYESIASGPFALGHSVI